MKILVAGICVAVSFAGMSTMARAADADLHANSKFGFVGELDLEYGGDNVATVLFTNGSSQNVRAGQGGTLAIGMHYRPARWDVDFSATVGYKFVTTAASNANIGISRTVFQILATYDPANSWWIAAGPVWHQGVKFDADGLGPNLDLGDSVGFTIQGGWKWIGLTYTNMEYTEQTTGRRNKFDASAIGLSLRWKS